MSLPETRLDASLAARFHALVAPDAAADDHRSRLAHATGRSYTDLARLRAGAVPYAPDLVLRPRSAEEVAAILALAASSGVAVVPFGGGTSVTGALTVTPPAGEGGVASLDLAALAGVDRIDPVSRTARAGAGTFGPDLEAALAPHGLTGGHFPESFEYSTVGGWIAAASSGQTSTTRGSIADRVAGLTCVTPAGTLTVRPLPARAEGPDLTRALFGSEGTLGVITGATLRLSPRPEACHDAGVIFPSFEDGLGAARSLVQDGPAPDVLRLSDAAETAHSGLLLPAGGAGTRLARRAAGVWLRAHGVAAGGGALLLLGFEGSHAGVAARSRRAIAAARRAGGVYVGARPGRAWRRRRFLLPYLRDALLDRGVLAETLETAAPWSALPALHAALGAAIDGALRAARAPGVVLAHVSHAYADGASLYVTVLARADARDGPALWETISRAATGVILASGAALSHHHGIGRDRARSLGDVLGPSGVALLGAVRRALDPAGIMNPGAVLPR